MERIKEELRNVLLLLLINMKKTFGAINQIHLSSDELKKGVFSKSYFDSNNHDLFGNKNVFIISLQDQKAAKEIVETLQIKKTSFAILIIKCVSIKKNIYVKNFFEKSKEDLIVPCYEENETDKKYDKGFFFICKIKHFST